MTPEENRAEIYKAKCDPMMTCAQAYEKEGNQTKADEIWEKWTALKARIRTAFPDA